VTHADRKSALARGVKFGREPKLTAEQIDHARKLIEECNRRDSEKS